MARAELLYISASTNRHSHAADVSSSLICFASQKLIALWDTLDPTDSGVFVTLPGHQAEVNCVKFMQSEDIIASGDQKGILQVRMKKNDKWKIVIEQPAHQKPISSLATHGNLIVTGASDATVKLWRLTMAGGKSKDSLDFVQSLHMNGRYPLSMQLTNFPGTACLILAVAYTGREVNIYSGSENQLVYSVSLSGHEDWVTSLAFTQSRHSPPQLTLASGSQDGIIRLWSLESIPSSHPQQGDDAIAAFETSLVGFSERDGGRQLSTKHLVIAIKSSDGSLHHFSLVLDALLVGHETSVTSLSWRPQSSDSEAPATLLSTSGDSSLILWSPSSLLDPSVESDSAPLWVNQQRFGDVGGQRFGGFVGGLWAGSGFEVLGWCWNGGWRRWRCLSPAEGLSETWEEVGALTGHQGVVKSIAWAPHGEYLLSTGLDQTSRIHGPHHRELSVNTNLEAWHELARPQVHGYDIVGAEFMSPLQFVSIADEKVARVFDAPKSFVSTVNSLGTVQLPLSMESRPAGANVPPLGLSNKATNDEQSTCNNAVTRYPFESELTSATLWPEIEKIFGHGYELISVATSHSGTLVATACKSTTTEHAVLRLYSTNDWKLVGEPLGGHALTVTRISFSPDDSMILSVSRDRTWRLFHATNGGYSPIATEKCHGRIVWDCAWIVEKSAVAFATASRDKTIKIWQPTDESLSKWTAMVTLKFKEPVTAIAFSPVLCDTRRRLAVGLESGEIFIYSSRSEANDWVVELTLDSQLAHVDTIHRILWRPSHDKGLTQQLATCSEDRTIKLMTVHLGFH